MRFQECSLAKANFHEMDVRRIDFDLVEWDTSLGRNAVYDEIRLRKKDEGISFHAVERLYRELKCNYEDRKDFQRVGDFYYGEMEMHRLGMGWQRWVSLEQLYWLLSGYGERPRQAGLVLVGLLMALMVAVLATGLNIKTKTGVEAAGWGYALLYVFEKGFLMRPEWAEPTGFWVRVVGALSIILPAQVALFFLAVRNKLGRRR